MLAFEPPGFGPRATLGGTIACGLSGPRRPYAGAARDFVLGVKMLNGKGEILRFGGEVMKNVAGYDLSRLLTGSLGTLGVILEVSLKVLPRPVLERTLAFSMDQARAIDTVNRWAGRPLPISATAFDGERLLVRLSGTESGVESAARDLGGETPDTGNAFWNTLNEQTLAFFQRPGPLWRLSVPPTTAPMDLPGQWFLEWGGAQRWLSSDAPAAMIREATDAVAGHATLFRHGDRQGEVFHPLPPALLNLHRRLKQSFDPAGIFNPGRLYPEF
jgi:glycolate oxidase FAD binding subunit